MNEPNSKKILFNKSSLLSLKAELLRKQEEVNEKKQLPQHKLENFKPPAAKTQETDTVGKLNKKTFKDSLKAVEIEDLETNRKVRSALEKKAELYEHLVDDVGNSQLAGRFLVDFNSKKQIEQQQHKQNESEDNDNNKSIPEQIYEDEDGEWFEFTDCLGRTRKCLKSDLDLYKKRDEELMKVITKEQDTNVEKEQENSNSNEKPFLVQKTNDYLKSLREKWEQKENELMAKDKDVHYQDLLFDEARIHGVAYYSFSTDETERRKQMEELTKQRQETLKAQEEAEQIRKKRDALMAARVAAARARQRVRAGLPPEEPKENEKDFTTCLLEFLTQQKNEADANAKEEERKAKEEKEKERQKLREEYVREWDLGKDGVDEKVKKFREMTQEEYVEQQRSKRIDEFAPLQASSSSTSDYIFDDKGRMLSTDANKPVNKTWSDVRPRVNTPPPLDIGDIRGLVEQKGLYFSSTKTASQMKYKNFTKEQEPVPIENELSDEESSDKTRNNPDKRKYENSRADIEPPPIYEYYGPTTKKTKQGKPFESDMREAYAQGAKSLESKAGDRQLSKSYDFTFD